MLPELPETERRDTQVFANFKVRARSVLGGVLAAAALFGGMTAMPVNTGVPAAKADVCVDAPFVSVGVDCNRWNNNWNNNWNAGWGHQPCGPGCGQGFPQRVNADWRFCWDGGPQRPNERFFPTAAGDIFVDNRYPWASLGVDYLQNGMVVYWNL